VSTPPPSPHIPLIIEEFIDYIGYGTTFEYSLSLLLVESKWKGL